MTIEEKLRETILSKHKSVLEFTESIGMPYGTIQSIFKRGINNSSVTNIIKICVALGISADELAKGKIVPVESLPKVELPDLDLEQAIRYMKNNYEDFEPLSIDGKVLSEDELDSFYFAIETFIRFVKRKREAGQ